MVTLLVISYKSYNELPNKLSDFYDALFQTLLQRHDGTKPGFIRKRGCTFDDSQYRNVFETLCILAKKFGQQSFGYKDINALATDAIKKSEIQENAQCYIDDIVKITSLILRDGEEYRFIHKTVQEYYTASYIANKPESWAIEFYTRICTNKLSSEWKQELEFLSEIDSYRFKKYYFLPLGLEFFNISEHELDSPRKKVTLAKAKILIKCLGVRTGATFVSWIATEPLYNLNPFHFQIIVKFTENINIGTFTKFIREEGEKIPKNERAIFGGPASRALKGSLPVNFTFFLSLKQYKTDILKTIDEALAQVYNELKTIRSQIYEQENPSLLDDLI